MKQPADYPTQPTCETCGSYSSQLEEGMCKWCRSHYNLIPNVAPGFFKRTIRKLKSKFK